MKRVIDSKIWKTGHSLVITIPKKLAERWKLKKGDKVEITIKK